MSSSAKRPAKQSVRQASGKTSKSAAANKPGPDVQFSDIQFNAQASALEQVTAEVWILFLTEEDRLSHPTLKALDKVLKGALLAELKDHPAFAAKLGDTLTLPTYGQLKAKQLVLVGLGPAKKMTGLELRRAAATAVRLCQKLKAKTVGLNLPKTSLKPEALGRLLAEGTILGSYQFNKYKQSTSEATQPGLRLTLAGIEAKQLTAIKTGLKIGEVLAQHVNLARTWVEDSANVVTPTFLKQQAEAIKGLSCSVLDFKQIKKLGMGAFELVAQGSDQPPYLLHLAYKPAKKAKKIVAIVGKGITFDSGGLSLKPAGGMELMKMDMAGAAATLATLKAIAELKKHAVDLDIEVHGFIPTCENMPSGHSSKPGDIIRSMNGKTIEVNNTDAEGRLILCDALTYAQQQIKPDEIVDLATLTGACIVALGKVASGIMGNNQPLVDRIRAAGEAAGEKFWQLPLYDEYKDALKSPVADLINAGSKGEAGTSTAGKFLEEFIDAERAWAHLDIAGPAYISKDLPEVPKGATGVGVRTLLYYLYKLSS